MGGGYSLTIEIIKILQYVYGYVNVKLGDIITYEQPLKYIVKDTKYNDNFTTPVLTAGQTFILGYTDEIDNIYKADKSKPVIIFDDFTGAFKWVDFNFKVKSSAIKILYTKNNDVCLLKYIYYIMSKINFKSDEHKRLWISNFAEKEILLPPIDVQNRFVNVLGNFDKICTDLGIGLPAEIEKRKQQYEYYRNKLLTFEMLDN